MPRATRPTYLHLASVCCFAICFLLTGSLQAQQTRIVQNLNDSGTGSLRQAIAQSNPGDTITFNPAVLANGSATLSLSSSLIFNKSLTIRGLFIGSDSLSISANNITRVFLIDGTQDSNRVRIYLENLILKDGWASTPNNQIVISNGGGIMAASIELLSLRKVILRNNHVKQEADGGGLYAHTVDTIRIQSCRFSSNTTDLSNTGNGGSGAGAYVRNGILLIDSTDFIGNLSVRHAGGLYKRGGELWMMNCKFLNNKASQPNNQSGILSYGGGAHILTLDTALIDACEFRSNEVRSQGAAIHQIAVNSTFRNSVFINNDATDAWSRAGAISSSVGYWDTTYRSTTILNCEFENNTANGDGGVIDVLNHDIRILNSFIKLTSGQTWSIAQVRNGNMVFRNSTISNTSYGNAFRINGGNLRIRNSTVLALQGSLLAILDVGDTVTLKSSVFLYHPFGSNPPSLSNREGQFRSLGNNLFGRNSLPFMQSSDQRNILLQDAHLKPLGLYGGSVPCMPPDTNSPALNSGDPTDFTMAVNSPIFGTRDCGAAESSVVVEDTALLCQNYSWWGKTYTRTGYYTDTLYNANSIDSIGYLYLEKRDSSTQVLSGLLRAPSRDSGTTYQWIQCDANFTPIAGATDSTFQPTLNGSYAVVMTSTDCIDTSTCVEYNQVSLAEENAGRFLHFYPNPSLGRIYVAHSDRSEQLRLRILDVQGRPLMTFEEVEEVVELGALPSGVYLLEWKDESGRLQRDRLIVQ